MSSGQPSRTEPSAPPGLRVGDAGARGRGVFATRAFRTGEVIEVAPVLVFPRALVEPLRGSRLDDYQFWWDDEHNAIAFGCASLYNHACPATCRWERDREGALLVISAARDVAPGEQLTINYMGPPDCPDPVWFDLSP